MPTTQQLSEYARTAQAAYALTLIAGGNNTTAYVDARGSDMAAAQAESFNATWNVLQQSPVNVNGFSAVLLQNRATGEKVLAIAGTDPTSPADIITDLVNIAVYGTVLGMPQYASLEAFYTQLVNSGKLDANAQLTVTGHSLGGFLAQAFTARHSSAVSAAYTYNAPGFGSIEALLGFIGITDTSAAGKITNVHASDGLSMTAGLGTMLGNSQPVRIEADAANPLNNHSVVRLGDALAAFSTYATLQPSLTTAQIEAFFVAAGRGDRRLEDTLDALRTAFIGSASNDANKTPAGNRDRFYINLQALQDDAGLRALSGQVSLVATSQAFASQAQADTNTALAYRYALLELLPFAVVASTAAQNQTLYGNYAQRLSLYDETTGQGELTRQWLADRAGLLGWQLVRNEKDIEGVLTASATGRTITEAANYQDIASATQILVGATDQMNQRVQVLFGGAGADLIEGFGRNDHLYGGAGDDALNGLGGNDYLEGNAGNDTLDGGQGNDSLMGGAGDDVYRFASGWGHDVIQDASGQNSINVEGIGSIDASNAQKVADGVWRSSDKQVNYSLVEVDATHKDLIVTFSDRTDTITIRNWGANNAGVTPPNTPAPQPVPSNTFAGDYIRKLRDDDPTRYLFDANGNYASAGAQPDSADLLSGTATNDAPNRGGRICAKRATFPEHWKPSARGARRGLVTDFPFSVVSTQAEYGVLIHAIADDRRLPEYWLSRL